MGGAIVVEDPDAHCEYRMCVKCWEIGVAGDETGPQCSVDKLVDIGLEKKQTRMVCWKEEAGNF